MRYKIISAITAAMDFSPNCQRFRRPDSPVINDVDSIEVVDVLFGDEAAQMSLANGDPQRLDQPMQGRIIGACMTTQCRLFR